MFREPCACEDCQPNNDQPITDNKRQSPSHPEPPAKRAKIDDIDETSSGEEMKSENGEEEDRELEEDGELDEEGEFGTSDLTVKCGYCAQHFTSTQALETHLDRLVTHFF